MGLRITSLSFSNFRNYESFDLADIGDLTVFIGRNGIGKTNILEGVSLLSSADSFRHAQINQLLHQGRAQARMEMEMTDGNRLLSTALSLEPGKKRFTVNGSSSVRRQAIDDLGAQLSKNYYVIQRDYEKILRYKNRLLKEESHPSLVDAMNDTLLTCATQLFCYRHSLHRRMVPLVEGYYGKLSKSGEPFGASYLSSWDYLNNGEQEVALAGFDGGPADKDRVREHLEQSLARYSEEERRRHRSIVGPHNDKLSFYLSERDASCFASQGQQRCIVLAWKLAEVEIVRQTLGSNPVLLLDDVMSELDEERRDMLVREVGADIQTFMTSTDLTPFNDQLLSRARVVDLDGGYNR